MRVPPQPNPAAIRGAATALETNVRGVLYGAIYSTFLTQTMKSVIILAHESRVPRAAGGRAGDLSFIIGFFPIVGSWSVYVPVAVWLAIFRNAPGAGDRDGVDRLLREHGLHLDVPAPEDRRRAVARC